MWLASFLYFQVDGVRTSESFVMIRERTRVISCRQMSTIRFGIRFKEHGMGISSNVSSKAWENRKKDKLKPQLCLDDDKMLQHPQPLKNIAPDEDDGIICRQHHTRDNRKGKTIHAVCYAASGVPLHIAFQKSDVGLFDTLIGLFESLFNAPGPNNPPDFTNWATLNCDRAYMRITVIDLPLLTRLNS